MSGEMAKNVKCFLITSCFIALGLTLFRFAFLYRDTLSSKIRIYSYYIGEYKLQIGQLGNNVERIEWPFNVSHVTSSPDETRNDETKPVVVPVEKESSKVLIGTTSRTGQNIQESTTVKPVVTTQSRQLQLCSKEGEKLGKIITKTFIKI